MPVSKCSPTGRRAFRRIFPRAIQRLPRKAKGNGHRTYAYSRAVQQPRAGKPREATAPRPFETRCGAFFRAQFIGPRAARKETDTGLMRTHAPFSSPAPESPAKRPPHALSKRDAAHFSARNSSAPAPLERKRTQDLCVLTRRSAALRAANLRAPVGSCGAAGNRRPWLLRRAADALPCHRPKGGSRTLIRRFGSPRSTLHSTLFDVYRIADLRAHFKASVSRPAKTASCRLKKTRRRARSVPRPRQCVLKGGSSAGPRAPLSPLHLPNVLDNAV